MKVFLAAPDDAQTTARGVQLFCGRRALRDRGLLHAVVMGYGELIPHGRYPTAVVFVDPPAGSVDVNVHPQKVEVRFARPQEIFAAVRHAVASALARAPWLTERSLAAPAPVSMYAVAAMGPPAQLSEMAADYGNRQERMLTGLGGYSPGSASSLAGRGRPGGSTDRCEHGAPRGEDAGGEWRARGARRTAPRGRLLRRPDLHGAARADLSRLRRARRAGPRRPACGARADRFPEAAGGARGDRRAHPARLLFPRTIDLADGQAAAAAEHRVRARIDRVRAGALRHGALGLEGVPRRAARGGGPAGAHGSALRAGRRGGLARRR